MTKDWLVIEYKEFQIFSSFSGLLHIIHIYCRKEEIRIRSLFNLIDIDPWQQLCWLSPTELNILTYLVPRNDVSRLCAIVTLLNSTPVATEGNWNNIYCIALYCTLTIKCLLYHTLMQLQPHWDEIRLFNWFLFLGQDRNITKCLSGTKQDYKDSYPY